MRTATAALPGPAKYFFARALRPFSLSVALVTCGLGIALGWQFHAGDSTRAILIMLAGILLQSAVNLFNDHADLKFWNDRTDTYAQNITRLIKRNTNIAIVMTALAAVIGAVLIYFAGIKLLLLGLAGLLGGYFYTAEPVAYKNRGLGIVGVFFFTGILMVTGSCLALTGQWSLEIAVYSVPVSLISVMLLLANELRDHREDQVNAIRTFTVRAGFQRSAQVYFALMAGTMASAFAMAWAGMLSHPFWLLVPLAAIRSPLVLLLQVKNHNMNPKNLQKLPPLTGRFFVVFGVMFILAL